jgi:hypothetical protein
VLWLVLATGCAFPLSPGSTTPVGRDASAIDAVLAEGARRGLTSARFLEERRDRMVIVEATDEVMRDRVGYCAYGGPVCAASAQLDPAARRDARVAAGCLLGACAGGSIAWVQNEPWPFNLGRWRVELFVSAYLEPAHRVRTLIHEAVHFLADCTRGAPDYAHANQTLWGPDGIERAVQSAMSTQ